MQNKTKKLHINGYRDGIKVKCIPYQANSCTKILQESKVLQHDFEGEFHSKPIYKRTSRQEQLL